MSKKVEWVMPEWMENYRKAFTNTGGNTVEELMNWKGTMDSNMPMALLQCCVIAQVGMLTNMYNKGMIS